MARADSNDTTVVPDVDRSAILAAQEMIRQTSLKAIGTIRKEASAEVERLIALLDATDGYTLNEQEEEEGECEPDGDDVCRSHPAHEDDEEEPDREDCGDDEPDEDDEPSLGWPEMRAAGGANACGIGDDQDREEEHDGREPDDRGIADFDGYMEQCPALFQHCDTRLE